MNNQEIIAAIGRGALDEGPIGKFRGQKIRVPFSLIDLAT